MWHPYIKSATQLSYKQIKTNMIIVMTADTGIISLTTLQLKKTTLLPEIDRVRQIGANI